MKKRKILLIVFIILSIGLLMVYSSSHIWAQYKENDSFYYFKRQAIFVIVGLLLLFFFSKIDYHLYQKHSLKIIILATILLVLVLIPGVGIVRGGSRSWFNLGLFALQPSEIYKIALIIYVSDYISHHYHQMKKLRYCLKPLIVMGIGFFLIMLQPDFGTGVIIVMSIIGLLFIAGVDLKFFMGLGAIGALGVVGLILVAPYRLQRILSFLNPWSDPLGSGFQIIQSLYAIGPGGLFGYGFLNSRQKHFYLPEPQTDFIFSIISEEFGFMGVVIVVSLFLIIIIRGFRIARNTNDKFSKYLAFGIIFELAFQAILNLMVVVGLIPVTGVTLPFLSYGGSSLLITLCGMGIVLNISRYQR